MMAMTEPFETDISVRNVLEFSSLKHTFLMQEVLDWLRPQFENDGTGHDWWHIQRVWKMACFLQEQEGGIRLVVELGALLHEVADLKLKSMPGQELTGLKLRLEEWLVPAECQEPILRIVSGTCFKGAGIADSVETLEAKIVQDADRLDAMGAIGIARAFTYGGAINQCLFDPLCPVELHQSEEQYRQS